MSAGFEVVLSEIVTNTVVDRVSERWGVRPTRSGNCVWFELPAGLTA